MLHSVLWASDEAATAPNVEEPQSPARENPNLERVSRLMLGVVPNILGRQNQPPEYQPRAVGQANITAALIQTQPPSYHEAIRTNRSLTVEQTESLSFSSYLAASSLTDDYIKNPLTHFVKWIAYLPFVAGFCNFSFNFNTASSSLLGKAVEEMKQSSSKSIVLNACVASTVLVAYYLIYDKILCDTVERNYKKSKMKLFILMNTGLIKQVLKTNFRPGCSRMITATEGNTYFLPYTAELISTLPLNPTINPLTEIRRNLELTHTNLELYKKVMEQSIINRDAENRRKRFIRNTLMHLTQNIPCLINFHIYLHTLSQDRDTGCFNREIQKINTINEKIIRTIQHLRADQR